MWMIPPICLGFLFLHPQFEKKNKLSQTLKRNDFVLNLRLHSSRLAGVDLTAGFLASVYDWVTTEKETETKQKHAKEDLDTNILVRKP